MKKATATVRKGNHPLQLAPVPRDVRLTANGKAAMGVAIMLAAAAVATVIGLTILRAHQVAARTRIARDGVAAQAEVTRVTRTRGDDPRTDVVYQYAASDGAHEGAARFSQRAGRNISEGGRLAITYLRSDPSRSWAVGREPGVLPVLVIPAIALALLLIAGAIAWHVGRCRELMTEGRLAQARVLESTRVTGQHGGVYRLRYQFTTLSGATITGKVERGRTISVGETIPIVYHRENPNWNSLYPLSLVTPDRQ